MKEQEAAHPFEAEIKELKMALVTRDGKLTNKVMFEELTRLRSELQDTKDYYEKAQQHLIDEHFSELQQKDEVINEIYEGLQLAYGELIQVSSNPVLLEYKKSVINKIESLIKKTKLNN